jgi:integrase/ribosomal protein L40E
MAKDDIYGSDRILDKTAERYISKLGPEDREEARRFVEDLSADGYSAGRITKYLASLVTIRRRLGKAFHEVSQEDVKRFSAKLERSDYKDWTKHDLRVILRRYLRWLGKGEAVDWMRIKQPKNGDLPEEVLTEEEIREIALAAYTTRDKAFLLSLYESGCRIGEFLPLRLKHVAFDQHGAVLRVTGKSGDRRVRLVFSALPLQRWIEGHPAKNDPDAYLWCKIPMPNNPKWKNHHLSYGFVSRLLKELAVKAGVKKRVNPHAFRHARATFLARHLKEPEMREFFGWGRNSEMPSIYVHLSGRDVDGSVLSVYGIKEAESTKEPVLKGETCPKCGEPNDPASRFCRKCGLPLKDKILAGDRMEEVVMEFLKVVIEANPAAKPRLLEIVREKGMADLFS